jgi:hypothetical protein
MAFCGLGVAGSAWAPAADVLRVGRHRLSELVPVLLAVYLLVAVVAAWAWARFDVRRAAVRLPIVAVLGAVGILVLLVAIWIEQLPQGSGGEGAAGSSAGRSQAAGISEAEPGILATALVDADEAAAVLGTAVGPADVRGRFLMRGGSLCRYRALDRSATLTVIVRETPRPAAVERLIRKGDPVGGLGDRAAAVAGGVWAFSGDWLVALTVHRRDRRAEDRRALVEGVRQVVGRLPR